MSDQQIEPISMRLALAAIIFDELREYGPELGIDVATSVLLSSVVAVRRFMEKPDIATDRRDDLAQRLAVIPTMLTPLLDAATAAEAMQRNAMQSDVTYDVATGRVHRPKVVG